MNWIDVKSARLIYNSSWTSDVVIALRTAGNGDIEISMPMLTDKSVEHVYYAIASPQSYCWGFLTSGGFEIMPKAEFDAIRWDTPIKWEPQPMPEVEESAVLVELREWAPVLLAHKWWDKKHIEEEN